MLPTLVSCLEQKKYQACTWHPPCSCLFIAFAGTCSAAVAALISLITPLPYSADFRPYFTIHDSMFPQMSSQELPSNSNSLPRLLGVTNFYFLKVSLCHTGQPPMTFVPCI